MDIHRIQSDPRLATSIRRVGRAQRDGDQEKESFSEALAEGEAAEEEEDPRPTSSSKAAPPGGGDEGIGGRLDVLG